jgi:hypothetical protein
MLRQTNEAYDKNETPVDMADADPIFIGDSGRSIKVIFSVSEKYETWAS